MSSLRFAFKLVGLPTQNKLELTPYLQELQRKRGKQRNLESNGMGVDKPKNESKIIKRMNKKTVIVIYFYIRDKIKFYLPSLSLHGFGLSDPTDDRLPLALPELSWLAIAISINESNYHSE